MRARWRGTYSSYTHGAWCVEQVAVRNRARSGARIFDARTEAALGACDAGGPLKRRAPRPEALPESLPLSMGRCWTGVTENAPKGDHTQWRGKIQGLGDEESPAISTSAW